MAVNSRLNCQQSPHSAVFRAIDGIVRRDKVASRVFKTFRSWQGSDDDAAEPSADQCPWLRLTPSEGGDQWYGPDSFQTQLVLKCRLAVTGGNLEDAMDLVQVVRRALYPASPDGVGLAGLAIQKRLLDAGATTGEAVISSSAFAIDTETGAAVQYAEFEIRIEVKLTINP